jgi:hypothetical protein
MDSLGVEADGEAIHQGTAVADQERNRLKLGTGPVPELPEIVESQRVRVGLLPLDDSREFPSLRAKAIVFLCS